jgi:propionyl-CoA carboxylase alpha subunit
LFNKILIANRGEIAVRIIRTCRKLGIGTVVVYSDADQRHPCVEQADEAALIGPAPASESYLVKERIIEAAIVHECEAVHPGYGFLSENAGFAQMVIDAGLVFIGPTPKAIALLGDKVASKALAEKCSIPVVPAHPEPLTDPERALALAGKMTFPLLLKPAAGGGGRGMRIVNSKEEFISAFRACQEETIKGFSDDRVFIEKYVINPRHIEFQIMGDQLGHIIHLGDRECSIQRRYQKVIEESPSPAMDRDLRAEVGSWACRLAREADYTNAGTVEFIMDEDRNLYFLEMNTRLQVEHPVTEMVTGLDLVELQLGIAAGDKLPLSQEDVVLDGWAIEARICAEDPARDFFPTTGIVTRYAVPKGKNIRVDDGIRAGSAVTIHYDSLLSKVIARGKNRDEATRRLVRALNGYHIEGLITNLDFANALVDHPAFASERLSTGFIDEHFVRGRSKQQPEQEKIDAMIMAGLLVYHNRQGVVRDSLAPMSPHVGFSSVPKGTKQYMVRVDEDVFDVQLDGDRKLRQWRIQIDGRKYEVVTPEFEFYRRRLKLRINGDSHMFRLRYQENHIQAFFCGIVRLLEIYTPLEWRLSKLMLRAIIEEEEDVLSCPMPGLVIDVSVAQGDSVRKGQELFRIESMKMQSGIVAPRDGKVAEVLVSPGNTVESDQLLLRYE